MTNEKILVVMGDAGEAGRQSLMRVRVCLQRRLVFVKFFESCVDTRPTSLSFSFS